MLPRFTLAGILLALPACVGQAQTAPAQQDRSEPSTAQTAAASPNTNDAKPASQPTGKDRRRAAKLFLAATKLFEAENFEEAMKGFQEAAALDPTNANYGFAAIEIPHRKPWPMLSNSTPITSRSRSTFTNWAMMPCWLSQGRFMTRTQAPSADPLSLLPLPACTASMCARISARSSSRSSRLSG